jgi:hypothetical protein
MKQSPSWEANRSSASQEIPHIVWNPKVHYRITLFWTRSTHSIPPSPLNFSSNPHPRLGLPSDLLPPNFPTKTLYALLPHTCYMPCPCHFSWFAHSNIFGEKYRALTGKMLVTVSTCYYCLAQVFSISLLILMLFLLLFYCNVFNYDFHRVRFVPLRCLARGFLCDIHTFSYIPVLWL